MIEFRFHVETMTRCDRCDLSRQDRLTLLRGQLTLIRMRAEQGIPVSFESIARAEHVARNLEFEVLAP